MNIENNNVTTQHVFIAVLSGCYWVFVEEVSLAGMPKPSLQGCIDGVFCNKCPITTTGSQGAEQLRKMQDQLKVDSGEL